MRRAKVTSITVKHVCGHTEWHLGTDARVEGWEEHNACQVRREAKLPCTECRDLEGDYDDSYGGDGIDAHEAVEGRNEPQ